MPKFGQQEAIVISLAIRTPANRKPASVPTLCYEGTHIMIFHYRVSKMMPNHAPYKWPGSCSYSPVTTST
jgi:hypothetical protein